MGTNTPASVFKFLAEQQEYDKQAAEMERLNEEQQTLADPDDEPWEDPRAFVFEDNYYRDALPRLVSELYQTFYREKSDIVSLKLGPETTKALAALLGSWNDYLG